MSKRMAGFAAIVFPFVSAGLGAINLFSVPPGNCEYAWNYCIQVEFQQKGAGTIIDNPSQPIYRKSVMALKLELAIHGNDARGRYVLNGPNRIVLDGNNNIYIQDFKESHILKFDEKGRFLNIIGRPGMGPGELDGLNEIFLTGNEIVASCPSTRRNVHFDLGGKYLRTIHPAIILGQVRVAKNGDIYTLSFSRKSAGMTFDLVRCDLEFKQFVNIDSRKWESFRLFGTQLSFDVTNNSEIVVGNPSGYEFNICDRSGKILKHVRKDYKRIKIPPADVSYLKNTGKAGIYPIPEYFEPYYRVYSSDDGKIFVNTHYTISGEKKNMFDVFDENGRFLGEISLGWYEDCLWRNGRLYLITEDTEGYPKICVYRVTWTL
jgi:hypothetical protein